MFTGLVERTGTLKDRVLEGNTPRRNLHLPRLRQCQDRHQEGHVHRCDPPPTRRQ